MTARPPWTPPELAPEEIAGKRFRVSWRGFNRDEVRRFLTQVAGSYEATLAQASEAAVLRLQLAQAQDQPTTPQPPHPPEDGGPPDNGATSIPFHPKP